MSVTSIPPVVVSISHTVTSVLPTTAASGTYIYVYCKLLSYSYMLEIHATHFSVLYF